MTVFRHSGARCLLFPKRKGVGMASRRVVVHGLAITADGPALRPAWDAAEGQAAPATRGPRETDWSTFWEDLGKRFDDDEGPIDYAFEADDEEPVESRYRFDSADVRLFTLADTRARGLTRAEFTSVFSPSSWDAADDFWRRAGAEGEVERLRWIMFCAVMAHGFLIRDRDYIVLGGEVVMTGEGTPASPDDYPDGIRQAVQAKENLTIGLARHHLR